MGLLYQAVQSQAESKRNFVLSELKKMGISRSRTGLSIDLLGYEELKIELARASAVRS
ncbi:hypothetical protein [Peribacillus loiseleuriae]|uniref:hypothetical protein n=1 Tax=Peribacillus loiseleuriae TaxID=1679170 RepID=UPI003D027019